VNEERTKRSALEERLAAVRKAMERGLPERAHALRTAADLLSRGHGSARADLKRLAHKLRGIVGTFGYQRLSELATELEQKAETGSATAVVKLARQVAQMAEDAAAKNEQEAADKESPAAGTGRRANARADRRVSGAAHPAAKPETPAEKHGHRTLAGPKRGEEAQQKTGTSARTRVLAVDDEQSDRMLLELTLGRLGGFEATVVGSPLEALQLLGSQPFDLVLADAMMPELNGRQFVRSVHESSAAGSIPVVILSAASPEELGWDMQSDGPTAWLRKPFVPRELVEQLRKILAGEDEGR
jgi:CheY-like chemotaxis protein